MMAEAAPQGYRLAALTYAQTPQTVEAIWQNWYAPFFQFVHDNNDVVRAVAYINADWDSQPMWSDGNWGDTRLQANADIQKLWRAETKQGFWLNASPSLFKALGYNK